MVQSTQEMFGKPSEQVKHEAPKYIMNALMKEGTSVREHVLNMMFKTAASRKSKGIISKDKTLLGI